MSLTRSHFIRVRVCVCGYLLLHGTGVNEYRVLNARTGAGLPLNPKFILVMNRYNLIRTTFTSITITCNCMIG